MKTAADRSKPPLGGRWVGPSLTRPHNRETTMKAGTRVRCEYRGDHEGTTLDVNDPQAWAGSLAFPSDNPCPLTVACHVARCRDEGWIGDKVPVLWHTFPTPRIFWDNKLVEAA